MKTTARVRIRRVLEELALGWSIHRFAFGLHCCNLQLFLDGNNNYLTLSVHNNTVITYTVQMKFLFQMLYFAKLCG